MWDLISRQVAIDTFVAFIVGAILGSILGFLVTALIVVKGVDSLDEDGDD